MQRIAITIRLLSCSNTCVLLLARAAARVLGSTGNLYTVHVGATCGCSCPDFLLRGAPLQGALVAAGHGRA